MRFEVWTKSKRANSRFGIGAVGAYLNAVALASGRRRAVHHGLQRSGTNYLLLWLLWHGVAVINHRDPRRSAPLHKHCRWQFDKSTLIGPIATDYGNSFKPANLDELDEICGLKEQPLHVVLFKEKVPWLASIANWGLNVGWFPDKASALAALNHLAADYDAFSQFWARMARENNERVLLIDQKALLRAPLEYERQLRSAGLTCRNRGGEFHVGEVPRSPSTRRKSISEQDVELFFMGERDAQGSQES